MEKDVFEEIILSCDTFEEFVKRCREREAGGVPLPASLAPQEYWDEYWGKYRGEEHNTRQVG